MTLLYNMDMILSYGVGREREGGIFNLEATAKAFHWVVFGGLAKEI